MNSIPVSESQSFIGLDSLITRGVKHLASLGYRHGTIGNYQYIWKEFTQFTLENSNEETFSTDLVFQFLNSCGISDRFETNMTFRQRHIRNVMHALTDFALHGCFQRRSHVIEKTKLSDSMGKNLSGYERFCREQLWSPLGTVRSRKRDITKFLHYLDSHDIKSVKEIQASTLSRFVTSYAHLKPATLARLTSSIRSFLRYLHMTGSIDSNIWLKMCQKSVFDGANISLQYGKVKTLMPFWPQLIEVHRVERETTQSCSWPLDWECA